MMHRKNLWAALALVFFFVTAPGYAQNKATTPDEVLTRDDIFTPSPMDGVGLTGLHPMREASECEIALQPTDQDFFQALVHSIRAEAEAGRRGEPCNIRMQHFIFRGDEMGWGVTNELIAAKRAGCEVQVIVDAVSNPEWRSQAMFWYMRVEAIDIQGSEFMYSHLVYEGVQPSTGFIVRNMPGLRQRVPAIANFIDRAMGFMHRNPWSSTALNAAVLLAKRVEYIGLAAANLVKENALLLRSARRLNWRYHDKMAIFGVGTARAHAMIGGANIALEYARMGLALKNNWRDQNVVVRGKIVDDIVATFDRNRAYLGEIKNALLTILNQDHAWNFGNAVTHSIAARFPRALRFHDFMRDRVWRPLTLNRERRAQAQALANAAPPVYQFEPADARFFQQRPRMEETTLNEMYVNLIDSAQSSVTLVNAYFVPTQEIRDALKRAALRGVTVTIITNSMRTNDTKPLTYVSRSMYKELMEAGCVIREWGADENESTIHAKFMIIDRRMAFVGSFNMDPRSWHHNSETGILFRALALVESLARYVEEHDFPLSTVVTMEEAEQWANPESWDQQLILEISKLLGEDL